MDRLINSAKRLTPIHLRVEPLQRPVRGVMLCDYAAAPGVDLKAGQRIYVIDNAVSTTAVGEACSGCGKPLDSSSSSCYSKTCSSVCTSSTDTATSTEDISILSSTEVATWTIRTRDGRCIVNVPAVCVLINETDEEAIKQAYA